MYHGRISGTVTWKELLFGRDLKKALLPPFGNSLLQASFHGFGVLWMNVFFENPQNIDKSLLKELEFMWKENT